MGPGPLAIVDAGGRTRRAAARILDWTVASGGGIRPGFFGEFTIIAGKPSDKTASLVFKAVQTYSDGKSGLLDSGRGSWQRTEAQIATIHIDQKHLQSGACRPWALLGWKAVIGCG